MSNLSIKNVPDALLAKLRKRAAQHHRSLQGEIMALLTAAVESSAGAAESVATRKTSRERRSSLRRIEQIAAEHRERWKKPFKQGPRAVDLIRTERDAR